ncbi:MAG: hypothetical protein N3C12_08805 [Candidatus Binatia bacterium]|nr:hypothetical protein [Candidatus Binatia bacterium]
MSERLELTEPQLERYSRQILVSNFGAHGQLRVLHSEIVISGRGSLTEALASSLARAGVGQLRLAETLISALTKRETWPDTRLSPLEGLLLSGRPSLFIDTSFSLPDWHRIFLSSPYRPTALWVRAASSHGLVGVAPSPELSPSCAGWFHAFVAEQTATGEPLDSLQWCASWAAALALRYIVAPCPLRTPMLFRYDTRTGEIEQIHEQERFRCGYCGRN